jgi:hypothetical protein
MYGLVRKNIVKELKKMIVKKSMILTDKEIKRKWEKTG